jgi:hypothetical protein
VGHLGGVLVGWLLLRRMGINGGITLQRLKWRWKRWQMRRNLRSVRSAKDRARERWNDNDRTFH